MKVTVHSVEDQLNINNKTFGLNDYGYNLAMDFLNKNQEYRGGERYEYFGTDMEIQFKWDMSEEQCRQYVRNMHDHSCYDNEHDYCGAMFFGNFKLEFITTPDGNYHNLFLYGAEGYDVLEDGTPYDEEYGSEKFDDHPRRTLDGFARNIEAQVVDWLNEYTQFIEDAIKPTEPAKWYPGNKYCYMPTITREA